MLTPGLNIPVQLDRKKALPDSALPDARGYYGAYGGAFVPETLRPALLELEAAFRAAMQDPEFHRELQEALALYSGRPTPLYPADRLSAKVGARVLLKREDLNHTGAHKVNNTLGQILLAKRMGKTRIIAETGAGQHGVGTACVAARMGLQCEVHMGEEDIRRQHPNVLRMQLMGAKVIPATCGTRTLKDATSEAIRDWVANVENTYYLIGSVMGPHPYPLIVREFQSVIGRETREQCLKSEGRLPDIAVACVGGGSNAMGMFHPFLADDKVQLVGVEAAGEGLEGRHAATMTKGSPGVLHGMFSYVLQDEDGQIQEAHSVSAGLDYPGVGPEHSCFKDAGRAVYESATDAEALAAFEELSILEGIIPAFESSHALAWVLRNAGQFKPDTLIALCLSGRGDKDLDEYMLRTGKTR
jgi:tryptophan synthase beta chain